MRHAFCSLILGLALALSGTAFAAVQEFGPDFGRFTVDVPKGWTSKVLKDGVQLTSADEKTSVAIQISKTGNATSEQLAQGIAKNIGGKTSVKKLGDNLYNVYSEDQGIVVTVYAEGGQMLSYTQSGQDTDSMKAILNSFKGK